VLKKCFSYGVLIIIIAYVISSDETTSHIMYDLYKSLFVSTDYLSFSLQMNSIIHRLWLVHHLDNIDFLPILELLV